MEKQKNYLTFWQKVAYGSGDFGSNFFYMLLTSFAMLYLGNYVGLDVGIVGTLMAVSKLLDGITDVFFGRLIDKTNTKMGKARPWMFFSAFPLALCLIFCFAIPASLPEVGKYAFFFVFYTAANALFYTANNISYAAMTAYITRNDSERVSLGTYRYIFAVVASVLVMSVTAVLVERMGGDLAAWRNVAILFAVVLLVFNSLASLSCKELPPVEEETPAGQPAADQSRKKENFFTALRIILTNKYYLLLLAIYLLLYCNTGLASNVGTFYFTYVIGDLSLMGLTSLSSFVMIVGLIANPILVKRFGMYRVNLVSYLVNALLCLLLIPFAYAGNLVVLVAVSFIRSIAMAPLMGSINALVAEVGQNAYLKTHTHVEGMMFSCSSIGLKVGSGIGAAMAGWLLSFSGYVNGAVIQPGSALSMIKFCYAGLPFIMVVLMVVCLWRMKVVEENRKLSATV